MLGRFRIKRKLGASATGTVFRAEDTLLEVPVGLKILSPALAAGEMYKAISREILLTRRLNHPGICRVHDLHEEKGHRFLTMDWVEGVPLDKMLARRQRLTIGDALRIVGAAGEAVAAAHEAGIVHRGLKPANLMVADDGMVTVMDFGHARSLDMGGQTVVNVSQEDMAFTAQEVLFGRPADRRPMSIRWVQSSTAASPGAHRWRPAVRCTRTAASAASSRPNPRSSTGRCRRNSSR